MYEISIFAIVTLIFLSRAIKVVPQGYQYTVQRFGRYTHTLEPGLHMIIPLVDSVGSKVNMMETVLEVPSQDVITKDNAAVNVDGIVFFQVLDAKKASFEVNNLHNAIVSITLTNIRTVMGSMDLDELLSNREVINARLLGVVDEATNAWGTKITRIEIKDIRPPRDIIESMGRQMKAERDKRAVILEAEGERQASILQAEGERQAAILQAEGIKQSMALEAQGRLEAAQKDAQARERLAQAEAHATLEVSQAISKGTVQAVNYFIAQKYVEAFGELAKSPNQKLVLMPMETSNLLGSIAGVSELIKESFSTQTTQGSSKASRTLPDASKMPKTKKD